MTEDELIAKHIGPNPNKPWPGEEVVRGSYVPVWSIVGYNEAYNGDTAEVASGFDVPVEAVEAALVFYRRHKCIIDSRIAANSG